MKIAYLGPEGTFSEEAARQYFNEEDVEYTLPVSLHLMANNNTELSMLKEVWSISPILTQCRKYIRNRSIKNLQYDSSASAAAALKKSPRNDIAAIGSLSLANLMKLNIIDWNIQDNLDNQTRFTAESTGLL